MVNEIECVVLVAVKLYQTSSSSFPLEQPFVSGEAVAPIRVPLVKEVQVNPLFTVTVYAPPQLSFAGGVGGVTVVTHKPNVPIS